MEVQRRQNIYTSRDVSIHGCWGPEVLPRVGKLSARHADATDPACASLPADHRSGVLKRHVDMYGGGGVDVIRRLATPRLGKGQLILG